MVLSFAAFPTMTCEFRNLLRCSLESVLLPCRMKMAFDAPSPLGPVPVLSCNIQRLVPAKFACIAVGSGLNRRTPIDTKSWWPKRCG